MKRDLKSKTVAVFCIELTNIVTNSSVPTAGIDTNRFESSIFTFYARTITDGTYTMVIQEADTDSDPAYSDLPADRIIGQATLSGSGDTNSVQTMGALPLKRFMRAVIIATDVSTGGEVGCNAVLNSPEVIPAT